MSDDAAVRVYFQKLSENAVIPRYQHDSDAGMDIYASEDLDIFPGETKICHTGLSFAIPGGYEIQIRPRSGLSLHTMLRIPNSPGTIDSGYRDELCVILHNASASTNESVKLDLYASEKENRNGIYHIKTGDRIAQMVLSRVPKAMLTEIENVREIGEDRMGGFGSTGIG